ncbi:MAG: MotA/TolQ/ExbB proton channel family protein [Gammaproteobacteria bacterium]
MKITKIIAVLALGAALVAPLANAQQARSVQELLRLVEQGRAQDSSENRQREQTFAANKADQQKLLTDARAAKRAAEQRSATLEETFQVNEDRIGAAQADYDAALGDLKELFGVIGQASADASADLEASMVNFQYPERVEYLAELTRRMGSASVLADMEDIEKLWYEIMREMAETGKVVKFQAPVILPSGGEEQREVVRVGGFAMVSDGKYLRYETEGGKIEELRRQPDQARFISSSSALVGATGDNLVKFGIDPTRGQILDSLINKPNFKERIEQGGIVGYIIMGLGVLALLIALERLITLTVAAGKVNSQAKSDKINTGNALGRVLAVADENKGASTDTLELKLGEAVLKETPKLNRGLTFLKIIFVVAPLLGLLGTVTGMIKTFQQIVLYGTGDPSLMAGGISQALVTTAQGLAVAIPTVLLHTFVTGRSRKIVHVLQEQSAGIIAERSERGG